MVATNLKAETLALMDKRASVEAEMNSIIEALSHPGGPGLSGNLVDREGFPREDIDIPNVLAQRHRLIDASAAIQESRSQEFPMDVDHVVKIPFAIVDEITDGSPAAEDGLQLGDQIIKFGNVEVGDGVLSRLASELQMHQDHPVDIAVMREGSLMNLNITPRQWSGRGLLGCHFRIL